MCKSISLWGLLGVCSGVLGMQSSSEGSAPAFYDFMGAAEHSSSPSSSTPVEINDDPDVRSHSTRHEVGEASSRSSQQYHDSNEGDPNGAQNTDGRRIVTLAEAQSEILHRLWRPCQQRWHETGAQFAARTDRSYNRFIKEQQRDQQLLEKFARAFPGDESSATAAYHHYKEQVTMRHRLSGRLHYARVTERDPEELRTAYDHVRENVFKSTPGMATRAEPNPENISKTPRQITMAKARLRKEVRSGVDPAIIERKMKEWSIGSLEDGRTKGAFKTALRKRLKLAPHDEELRAQARELGMDPDRRPMPVSIGQHHTSDQMEHDSSGEDSSAMPAAASAGISQESVPAARWDLNGIP